MLVKFAKKQKDDRLYAKAFKALLQVERYADAVALTEDWKKATKKDIEHFYVWALMMNSDIDLALNEINKLVQKLDDSDDEQAQNKVFLPYVKLFLSHWYGEQTLNMFARLYEDYPDNKLIGITYAELLRWNDKIDEAVAILEKQRFNMPRNIELVQKQSDFYRYAVRIEDADQVWADFMADYPNEPVFRLIYARYLFDRYDYKGALREAEKINDKQLKADIYSLRALALMHLGRFDDVQALFDKHFVGTDDEERMRYVLGEAANQLKQKPAYALAKKLLEPLVVFEQDSKGKEDEKEKESIWTLPAGFQIARAIYGTEGIKAGDAWLKKFEKIIEVTSDIILHEQANALQDAGFKDIAYQRLSKFLKANPNHELIRYGHSLVAVEIGLETVAIEDLRMLHAVSPDDMNVQNALGYTMLDNEKDIADGTVLIKKALFSDPASPAIVDSMGWALYRQGKFDQAMPFFRYAYGNFVDGEVTGHYIKGLYKQGQIDKAKKLYQLESQNAKNLKKLNRNVKDILSELE